MVEKEKEQKQKLNLADLIDIKFLQEFQDVFAKTANVASITVDDNGPITEPSNFTDFCIKYTRGSAEGYKRCNECDIRCGKIAAKTGKPAIYKCHSGLTDFAVPIIVEGQHIASILGGQVLTEAPNEEHFRKIAKELGINENDYIEAIRKIKIVPIETIKAAADLLYCVANSISEISRKNLELIKQSEMGSLQRRITETIRSSLDIDETLTFICNEVGKLFNVQRVSLVQNFVETPEELILKKEFKSRLNIIGLKDVNYDKRTAAYNSTHVGQGKNIIVSDISSANVPDYYKETYKAMGVKSLIALPIEKGDDKWGAMFLSEYDNYRYWTDDDINLLKTISSQIYIAIKQAELYKALKQNTSNLNAIMNNMPFMAWLKDDKSRLLAVNNEYAKMCSTSIEDLIGKTDFDFFPKEHAEHYFKDDRLVMEKGHAVITEESITGPDGERWHETIKSPVFDDKGSVVGTVGLARDITERKESELELLRRQGQIVKANKRESLLRNIFETMRSSLDVNTIKNKIVTELGKALNMDICFIMTYKPQENYFDIDEHSEYLSSPEEKSFVGANSEAPEFRFFMNSFKNNLEVDFANVEEYIIKNNLQNTPEEGFLKACNIKSSYNVPVYYANTLLGFIITFYTKDYKVLDESELAFLRTIATQAGIAINQAELYNTVTKTAEHEKVLRDIMLSTIKTFDVKEIITSIVTKIGRLFSADRCFFIGYDPETDLTKPIENYAEYLSSSDIRSHLTSISGKEETEFFDKGLKEGKVVTVSRIEDIDFPKATRRMLIEDLSVKSYLIAPVHYRGVIYGSFVLHYVKHHKQFSQDEMDLANAMANQSAIIMHQTRLHKITQFQAEKESLLRKIMLSLVNNFDIYDVIKSIVIDVGELFKADRCFFVEYTSDLEACQPIKGYAEYLSSDEIVSHVTRLPSKEETESLMKQSRAQKVIVVDDITKIDLPVTTRRMLDELSVKSYLVVPLSYGDKIFGALVLHYVNNFKTFNEEEIDLVKSIANQSAIVIRQAILYSTIKKNEEYTRTVLDSIKDSIITIDDDFIIESCNPATEAIWGYSSSEIIGQNLKLLLNHSCDRENKKTCLVDKNSFGIKKDGSEFPVEIDVSEIVFENKQSTMLVIRDITERKKIDKMKSEFVSTVSHELRTPLTSIKGSLGLVTSGVFGVLPDKVTNLINIANNNCTRLTNLINDILDLEKIKAGKYDFKYEELELNSLLEQSIILNQSYADQFGMQLKLVKLVDEVYVKADKNRLLQVISNLISNAVKFSNLGGKVVIKTEVKNNKVTAFFEDKGIGIPDDSKHKIFQSFSQVDSSDTRSKGGTGLGLSICKIIIEQMGGEIDFESVAGKGSTFFFTMPAIPKGSYIRPDETVVKELDEEAELF